jgi:ApeA N-terminal domain 1
MCPHWEDMRYRSVRVRFYNLEEFIGQLPSAVTLSQGGREVSIKYKEPEALTIDLGVFQVATSHETGFPIPASFLTNTISHTGWLRISSSDSSGAHIEEFLRGPVCSLQCLLSLVAGCRVPIITIRGENERTLVNFDNESIQMPATLFRWQGAKLPVPERRAVVGPQPTGLLFTLMALGKDLSMHVRLWHEAQLRYRQSFDLYFSLDPETHDNVPVEFHFLALITALESYHADAHDRCAVCGERKAIKKKRRDAIVASMAQADSVGAEDREWAENVLGNSLRPSLSERISEIYDEQPQQIQRVLGGKDEFVKFVARARNGLAHGKSASGDEAAALQQLWRTTKKLRLMLQIVFLRNMKLSQERVIAMLPNIFEYRLLQ